MNQVKLVPVWLMPFLTVAIAVAIRYAFDPWVGEHFPYGISFLAVAITALYSGFRPAVLATSLTALTSSYLFLEPRYSLAVQDPHEVGALIAFVGVSLVISYLGHVVHGVRRKLEESNKALRQSEGIRRLGQEITSIGSFEWNVKTGVNTWTPEFEALYGLACGAFPRTQAAWEQLVHPDDRQRAIAAVKKAFDTNETIEEEWRVVWPDGSTHWLSGRFRVIRDETGAVQKLTGVNIDITGRKQAAEALEASEKRFRTLAETIPQLAWIANADGYIHWYNRGWYDYTGTTPEQMEGWGWQSVHDPEILPRVLERWKGSIASGERFEMVFPLRGADGRFRLFLTRVEPFKDSRGRVVEWFGTNTDVEALKRAEEKLASVAQFPAENPDPVLRMDREGSVLYANEPAEALMEREGWSPGAAAPENLYRPVPAVLAEGEKHEFEIVCTDQHIIAFLAVPLPEKGYVNLYGRDITEARTAEEKLRASERNYRIVADNTYAWEFWSDPHGKYLYVSPSCLRWTGYEAKEFMADPHLFDRVIYPEDHRIYQGHRGHGDRCETEEVEFRIVRRDGEVRWIGHACSPVYDENGTFLGVRGSNRDITEQKRAQAELRAAQISAERAKAAAEKANAAKDQFLAVLSHELRTPLAPVLAGVTLLKRRCGSCDVSRELEIVERNIQLEARLIDDLLDLTRIERGKIGLERKLVNVCTTLERVVEICRPDIEARRLKFNIEIAHAPRPVYGDMSRLQQVFWNLLNNAIKFTPEGGSITLCGHRDNGQAIVEVIDNGIGLEPGASTRIFNAFEQGGIGVTRQFGGLGLGLAISKRLVELHGGTIEVESAGRNKGATFRVTLPLATPQAEAEAKAEAEAENAHSREQPLSRRILLVEDHGDTAGMMKELLQLSGYDVETVPDVAQSLEITKRQDFDVLISDIGLPDGSGLQLMEELRHRKNPLKGIALSGFGREEDVKRSKEAGFTEHLTKPVDFDTLLAAVERVI